MTPTTLAQEQQEQEERKLPGESCCVSLRSTGLQDVGKLTFQVLEI